MEYGLYTGEDGVIMEISSLQGIAGLLHKFGEYGGLNDSTTTMLNGLGVALFSIAHRLEKHFEEAQWPDRDTDEQVEKKRGTSGIWVMRELRQMGLSGSEDIGMALLWLGCEMQRRRKDAEREQGGEEPAQTPKKGRKNGNDQGEPAQATK